MIPLLLLAVAAVAAMVVLFNAVHRDSRIGAVLVLTVTVLQEAVEGPIEADLGPFAVTVNDVAAVLLGAAAVARMLRLASPAWSQLWIAGLGAFVVLLALRGAMDFGLDAAVNEARKYVWLMSTALYFSTVVPRPALLERIGRIWLVAAGALVALAVVRWVALAAGMSGGVLGAAGDSLRVLPAAPALLIAQGCLIALASWARPRDLGRRVAVASFALAVLFLQHRTVWVALVVGAAVLLTRDHGLRAGAVALIAVVVGALSVAALAVPADDSRIAADLERSATNADTFAWRYEGWLELIEDGPSDLNEVLVGIPFGTGYARIVDDVNVEFTPHNFYLQTYLRLGAIGTAALVGLHLVLAVRLRRGRGRGGAGLLGDQVLFVLLISAAVYDLTYAPSLVDGILLGLAASAAARAPAMTGTTGTVEGVLTRPTALARAGR